jgi:tetratricopeptide (TPR) repeat protein
VNADTMRWALAALFLVACANDEPAAAPIDPDQPRGPRGAAPSRCDGASDDPPEIEEAFQSGAHYAEGAVTRMEAIVGANAGSATARVRLGELLLRTTPPRPAEARVWFERGLELHEQGCALGYRDLWAAWEGTAHSHFFEDQYDQALPWLRRSVERWPDIRQTRYNLACALCKTGDLDGCERELHLAITSTAEPPSWLPDRSRGPEHYVEIARRDADLNALRADRARFDRAIAR